MLVVVGYYRCFDCVFGNNFEAVCGEIFTFLKVCWAMALKDSFCVVIEFFKLRIIIPAGTWFLDEIQSLAIAFCDVEKLVVHLLIMEVGD